ncbi:MAG: type IV pili methyl-accepting chemotaxis transducer N-terminal domain-containing protein [Casimicrobiaceae bacterium]|nr:type IV pili methyl-accepting chemotaxis transducer N-terminal domain-containing protein [Casimicrobiaceae bacterium]
MFPLAMFGKYRRLVIAVLLFIIIDLGLLLFNFFASKQLERDAERLTAVGEMRMLTQQLTKSVLTLQTEVKEGLPTQTSIAQLTEARNGFAAQLPRLEASLADDRDFVYFGIDVTAMRAILERVRRQWEPIEREVEPLLTTDRLTPETVEFAVNRAVARNISLANRLDDLAQAVKNGAERKVQQMRIIQISAILLAFLNFLYIVFHFVRHLRKSDAEAERARKATEDILGAVNEGLLLIYRDGTFGARTSASAETLLMQPCPPGASFFEWLDRYLDPATAAQAQDYIGLLFDPKVKPALLKQLDPLKEVYARHPNRPSEGRHLSFRFTQIRDANRVEELLVTVTDVTERVRLAEALETRRPLGGSLEELLALLEGDPQWVEQFIDGAQRKLARLNDALKGLADEPHARRRLLEEVAMVVHGIKGEAAAVGLVGIAEVAHRVEDNFVALRQKAELAGEDLIGVTLALSRLGDSLQHGAELMQRIRATLSGTASPERNFTRTLGQALTRVVEQTAERLGKQARLEMEGSLDRLSEAMQRALREILPQLVRNAVVHGIEHPEERLRLGKPRCGVVRVRVEQAADGRITGIEVSDDGGGLSLGKLRAVAEARGLDVAALDERALAELIFAPGVSTAASVSEVAGRGDGLARVRRLLAELGARLRVSSCSGQFTRFTIELGAPA